MKKSLAILMSAAIVLPMFLLAGCSSCNGAKVCQKGPSVPLFNGSDLTGWVQRGGNAKYEAGDGMIVGISASDTPNSFLCTEKTYGDFILEYEMKCTPGLNSGVQIRSLSKGKSADGRVYGYQVECDTGERAWSGGIYDEARRGWLYPLDTNPKGRKAFKNGQWNKFRVEAIGNSIKTYINGVQCADLVDDMTAEGFIALQVHAIGDDQKLAGEKIYWKNINIITDDPGKYALENDLTIPQVNLVPNYLSPKEKALGWRLLWDGKTTNGWRGAKIPGFPEKGWTIKDGVLTVQPSGGAESANGGDIVTVDKFGNFELKVDFKFTKGANSGIKYFVNPDLNKGSGSAIGCEFQILDDELHPDAKLGKDGNRTLASLYDLIRADNPYGGKRGKQYEWNQAYILANGKHVEHWLNNIKVVEYERGTQQWRDLVAGSKYKNWPAFGEAEKGNILLQDHGNLVQFRSIKIRELK